MIPVRVPAGTPVHIVRTGLTITAGRPLADATCPVCDGPLSGRTCSLVYVGTHPADRDRGGAYWTGAAVVAHDACVLAAEPARSPACPPDEVLDDLGGLARALGGERKGWREDLLRLIARSDPGNRRRLAVAFPRTVRAYELWAPAAPLPAGVLLAALDSESGEATRG
jgi:hypothetical protein